jgi:hypothetical protein
MRSIVLQILIAGVATSLAFAAPANADSGEYLHALQPFYPTLSTETLLSVGSKVCSTIRSGSNSTVALKMVQDQIGVSVSAAGDIVSAAVVHLDC